MPQRFMRYSIVALLIGLTLMPGLPGRAETYLASFDETRAEFLMLQAINQLRYQHGLPLVVLDDDLSLVSRRHALDMAQRDYFGHFSPEGASPDDRVHRAGLPYEVTENIGIIRTSGRDVNRVVDAVMESFLASPSHLANILDPNVTHVGVGFYQDVEGGNHRLSGNEDSSAVYTGFGTILVVQDFCRRNVRILAPSPFYGQAAEGEFVELRLDFTDQVLEAFLRIVSQEDPGETYEIPLARDKESYRARFAIDREGTFTIAIYANTSPDDWFYREQGRLELTVSPGVSN